MPTIKIQRNSTGLNNFRYGNRINWSKRRKINYWTKFRLFSQSFYKSITYSTKWIIVLPSTGHPWVESIRKILIRMDCRYVLISIVENGVNSVHLFLLEDIDQRNNESNKKSKKFFAIIRWIFIRKLTALQIHIVFSLQNPFLWYQFSSFSLNFNSINTRKYFFP